MVTTIDRPTPVGMSETTTRPGNSLVHVPGAVVKRAPREPFMLGLEAMIGGWGVAFAIIFFCPLLGIGSQLVTTLTGFAVAGFSVIIVCPLAWVFAKLT